MSSVVEALRQIVYISSAARLLKESELLEILQTARAANTQSDLTGILIYADGSFIQVLEGTAQGTERIMRKIKRDPRHRRFMVLLDRVIEARDFEDWPMGFQRVTQTDLDSIAGYFDWSADMPTRRKNAAAMRLIESFKRTGTSRGERFRGFDAGCS